MALHSDHRPALAARLPPFPKEGPGDEEKDRRRNDGPDQDVGVEPEGACWPPSLRTKKARRQSRRCARRSDRRQRPCDGGRTTRSSAPPSEAEINLIRMHRTALANPNRRHAQGRLGRLQRGDRRGRIPRRSPCAQPCSRKTGPCGRAQTPWRPRPLPGRQFAFPPADPARRKRDGIREGARLLQAPGCRPAQTRHVVHNRPGQQAVLRPADRGRIALA